MEPSPPLVATEAAPEDLADAAGPLASDRPEVVIDLEAVTELVRREAEARTRDGRYPPGVLPSMDRHVEELLRRARPPGSGPATDIGAHLDAAGAALERIERSRPADDAPALSAHNTPAPAPASAVGRLGRRAREVLAAADRPDGDRSGVERIDAATGELRVAVDALRKAATLLAARQADLEHELAAAQDLTSRLETLEQAERRRGHRPFYPAGAFEDRFRGTRAEIQERLADLADLLAPLAPVVDVGCGRGELLELLAARGVAAHGVEPDGGTAAVARHLGLDVRDGDGLSELARHEDRSLGAISLIQVIEHLGPQERLDLFPLAARVLRPGGLLVVETINPMSLHVYAHALYLDPTHTQPVHPYYLGFLAEQAGFASWRIEWRSPVPDGARTRVPREDPLGLEHTARLLFGPQDYVLIATR